MQFVRRAALVVFLISICSVTFAQTNGAILPGLPPVFTGPGAGPAANAKLCWLAAGTTSTWATVYSDSALASPLPNPTTLSALGIPQTGGGASTQIYLSPTGAAGGGNYKVILYAAGTGNTCNGTTVGAVIWTRDNVYDLALLFEKNFNNVRNCYYFPGANTAAKINACISDLPATGGTADARGFEGAQALTATITVNKPVHLILGFGTWTSTASPAIQLTSGGKFSDIGCGGESNQATFATTSNCILATTNTTGDIIQTQAAGTSVHDMALVYSGSGSRTGGAGINCRAGASVKLDNLRIVSTWIGIAMTEGSCSGSASRIWMDSEGAGSGGAWYAQIALGGCTALNTPASLDCGQAMAAVVTDLHFNEVILSVGSTMGSGAALLMDGGTDSISFNKLEIIKDTACTNTDCGILWKLQNSVGAVGGGFDPPRWITCFACEFEGAATNATNPDIYIQSAMGLRLLGNTDISGGTQGIYITAGSRTLEFTWDIDIADATFATAAQECIKVASPTGKTISGAGYAIGPLSIHHNNISGCSQSSSGGYNAIDIGADLTFFRIEDNYFEPGFSFFTNFPKNYIQVETGGSDNYYIVNNQFNPTHRTSGDLVDGGTGANKTIAFNQSGNSGGSTATKAQFFGSYSTTGGYGPTSLPNTTTVNIAGGGTGLNAGSVAFSDGSGRGLRFGYVSGGTFHPTFTIYDDGRIDPIATPSQITSSLATGTAPISVASTTPAIGLHTFAVAYNQAGTQITGAHFSTTNDALSGGTKLVTWSGSSAFSGTSYSCTVSNKSGGAAIFSYSPTSAGTTTVTASGGTGSELFTLTCFGS